VRKSFLLDASEFECLGRATVRLCWGVLRRVFGEGRYYGGKGSDMVNEVENGGNGRDRIYESQINQVGYQVVIGPVMTCCVVGRVRKKILFIKTIKTTAMSIFLYFTCLR